MATKRRTEVLREAGSSTCCVCARHWHGPNHQACAARHHDATGHAVLVHVARSLLYGTNDPDPAQEAWTATA